MRDYRIISLWEGRTHRWCVISEALSHSGRWVVIDSFTTEAEAADYIDGVRARQRLLLGV